MQATTSILAMGIFSALFAAPHLCLGQGLGMFDGHQDIGENPQAGSASFDAASGTYTIRGGGDDMWFDVDAFHFVWKLMTGDVALQADIEFIGEGVHERRKAVLMVRQSLDADSAYADVAVHANGWTALQRRPTKGGQTDHILSEFSGARRVRLERRGDQFTMRAWDADGKEEPPQSFSVKLSGPVYVGLGMCAHRADVVETATFSNVGLETQF